MKSLAKYYTHPKESFTSEAARVAGQESEYPSPQDMARVLAGRLDELSVEFTKADAARKYKVLTDRDLLFLGRALQELKVMGLIERVRDRPIWRKVAA